MDNLTAVSPELIRACRVHRFGDVDVIKIERVERPVPGEGEVLIRVRAAGVGPWDGWIRSGHSALPQPLPLTLGSDLAGIVQSVGSCAGGFKPGDAVFGVTNPRFTGAYAEYAVASSAMIALKPEKLSFSDAASVPVIAVTAYQALFEQARLARGQKVLIHGGAGNVGAFAVQLARRAGLQTVATAGKADLDYVRDLGADAVIDYRTTYFQDMPATFDAVIDLVGGETQARSFAVLKPGGALISAVSQPDQQEAARYGVRAAFFLVNVTTATLSEIASMLESGDLRSRVGVVLPFAEMHAAHEMLEGRRPHPPGKIVLTIEG